MADRNRKNMDALRRAWITAAKLAGVDPYNLTRLEFRKFSPAGHMNYTMGKNGGFSAIRERFFGKEASSSSLSGNPSKQKKTADDFDPGEEPKPLNPLETQEAIELKGEALVDYIGNIMEQCVHSLNEDGVNILPHELTWYEFAKYINRHYGIDDMKVAKYTITRAGGFNLIRDRKFAIRPTETTVTKVRAREEANRNRRLGEIFAREKYMLESIESFADRIFSGRIIVARTAKLVSAPTRRVLNVLWSDLHIGADIKKEETGFQDYGIVEEARRFAYVVKTISEYKADHRQETELAIILAGDLIQNHLHDPHDGAALGEQISRAIHLLMQGIAFLSGHFKKVNVYCTSGNHDRFMSEHPHRAINRKWNCIGTVIYSAVRSASRNLDNVQFHIPKTPYVTYEALGHRVFATHSDTVFDVGRPSKTIKVDRIESQVDRWNSSLPDDQKYDVIVCGHVHRLMFQRLDNGGALFTNGPLDPSDSFAVAIGCPTNQAGQWMWETTEDFACGDKRDILVGIKQDNDSSLDHIIEPFTGF